MATENIEVVAGEVETTVGMPQLDVSTWPNQIFWLLVALVAIYLILTRVALPRIGGVLAERSGAITGDLAAAEELKGRAVEAEAAYNDALARARAEAGRIAAEAKADIQRDLDAATALADAEIAARTVESEREIATIREGALSSVTEVATETAEAILDAFGGARDAGSVSAAVAVRMQGDAR